MKNDTWWEKVGFICARVRCCTTKDLQEMAQHIHTHTNTHEFKHADKINWLWCQVYWGFILNLAWKLAAWKMHLIAAYRIWMKIFCIFLFHLFLASTGQKSTKGIFHRYLLGIVIDRFHRRNKNSNNKKSKPNIAHVINGMARIQ